MCARRPERQNTGMFSMRGPLTFDPDLAATLATAADDIFGEDDKDVTNSLEFLVARATLSDGYDTKAVIDTLFYACNAMLDLFTVAHPDRPVCDTSDDLAVAVCQIWNSPEHLLLAQALLRAELDVGSLTDLPGDLRNEINLSTGSDLSVTMLELILAMSAMLALEAGLAFAGDPLRKAFAS
jgi:hypothetical protein